jgi:hypothetical protein
MQGMQSPISLRSFRQRPAERRADQPLGFGRKRSPSISSATMRRDYSVMPPLSAGAQSRAIAHNRSTGATGSRRPASTLA